VQVGGEMILLLGSSGYVGTEFKKQLEKKELKYITLSHKVVLDEVFLRDFLIYNNIKFVINAAGYIGKPNVDACELQKEETFEGNVLFPLILQRACDDVAVLGHVSSGCIYNEEDPMNPKKDYTEDYLPNFDFMSGNSSFYSGTKSLAETMLLGKRSAVPYVPKDLYIWRLRIPFDSVPNQRCLITKLRHFDKILKCKNSISRLSDFVRCCIESFEKKIPFGVYNVVNGGFVTYSDLIDRIDKLYYYTNIFERTFLDIEEFNKLVNTPRSNCVLSNKKLLESGVHIDEVDVALDKVFEERKIFTQDCA
jgi:dTDP-4-dehydrorhamnose reductase